MMDKEVEVVEVVEVVVVEEAEDVLEDLAETKRVIDTPTMDRIVVNPFSIAARMEKFVTFCKISVLTLS